MPFDSTDYIAPVRLLDRDPKTITEPRERLMYLRDFLRELPAERFRISSFFSSPSKTAEESVRECGTTACLAGWCLVVFSPNGSAFIGAGVPEQASDILGLDVDQKASLFWPPGYIGNRIPRTPTQAANVLDHLIQTGEVDWSKA